MTAARVSALFGLGKWLGVARVCSKGVTGPRRERQAHPILVLPEAGEPLECVRSPSRIHRWIAFVRLRKALRVLVAAPIVLQHRSRDVRQRCGDCGATDVRAQLGRMGSSRDLCLVETTTMATLTRTSVLLKPGLLEWSAARGRDRALRRLAFWLCVPVAGQRTPTH